MTNRYYLWPSHDHGEEFNVRVFYKGFWRCERAGGCYVMALEAADMLGSPGGTLLTDVDQDKLRARITTMLIDLRITMALSRPHMSMKMAYFHSNVRRDMP